MSHRLPFILIFFLLLCSCNKHAIEDLQSRLDRLENATIVSIRAQIQSVNSAVTSLESTQKQFRTYIEEVEAKGADLQDIVAALQKQDEKLSADLQALKSLVEQNSDDVKQWIEQAEETLSRINAVEAEVKDIRNYLETVESRLSALEASTKSLSDALKKNEASIQDIQQALQSLQKEVDDMKEQIEALMSSVQSIVVVPDYADGSVAISNIPDNTLYFEVYPLSAADLLAKLGASAVSLDAVETKADGRESQNFPVSATSFDGSYFVITVDGSGLSMAAKQGEISLNARLRISDGVVTRSSEYFGLTVKWDRAREEYTYTAKAVDLGLSVKWSAFNLGADTPEGYGAVFVWGETEPKQECLWTTYKWGTDIENFYTKYCNDEKFGTVDNKIVLEAEDDVAVVKLGGGWRTPTWEEMTELMYSCEWTWTKSYEASGVSGIIATSLVEGFEDQSIFFPAAGYIGNVGPQYAGSNGSYWSATLSNSIFIHCLSFDFLGINEGGGYRFHGRSIRPVIE